MNDSVWERDQLALDWEHLQMIALRAPVSSWLLNWENVMVYLSHLLTLYLLDLRGPKSTPNNGKSPFYSVLRSIGLILGCFILRSFQLSDRSQDIGPHICATDSEIEPHFIHRNTSLPMGCREISWGLPWHILRMPATNNDNDWTQKESTGIYTASHAARFNQIHWYCNIGWSSLCSGWVGWGIGKDSGTWVSCRMDYGDGWCCGGAQSTKLEHGSVSIPIMNGRKRLYIVWGKELEAQFNKRMILNALTSWYYNTYKFNLSSWLLYKMFGMDWLGNWQGLGTSSML